MGTYQDRRAAKVCVRCGRQTERTLAGRCRCQECEDMAIATRKYKNTQRRKKGLCLVCGVPSETRLCPRCREKEKEYNARWRAKSGKKKEAVRVVRGRGYRRL